MRLIPIGALAITLVLNAQESKTKARELLDSAAEMVSAASSEMQVASLMHIGLHYRGVSQKKAAEFLEQSFALTAALPESSETTTRSGYQAQIILRAAEVDTALAIELIRRAATPASNSTARNEAIAAVVSRLLAKQEIDRAIEVVGIPSQEAGFPYQAATSIFEKLPKEDPRRIVLFGHAVTAYSANPSGPFPEMLSRFWKLVPREMAQKGIAAIVNRFLDEKREGFSATVVANDDGSGELRTTEVKDVMEAFPVLRALDPKRAEELLKKYPVLGKVKEPSPSPEGEKKEEEDDDLFPVSMLSGMNKDTNMVEHFRAWNAPLRIAGEVMKDMEKNPRNVLDRAKEIPLASLRAEVIAKAARAQAAKDPESARSSIDKALGLLNELKSPSDTLMPRLALAEAFFAIKDEPAAWKAFEGVFTDIASLYTKDTDAKSPNKALREFWPSIQTARIAGFQSAKHLSEKAEGLLANIQVVDVALAARIEMANALLGGKNPIVNSIQVNF